ncbi:MAG: DUF3744 domain-containing protein, partial [Lachnospiraceae bacterium]|nr:DUF3744 domain-containing protein [Lachnospiraceae bacterium]
MSNILEFKDFGFKYDAQSSPTLFDINFSIKKGEKVLIAGPSGCGKSTLVHCMNGLVPFSYRGKMTGSLSLFDKETKDLSLFEISKHVGTVLQDSDAQFVGLTVAEDIAFALENDCITEPRLHERVLEVAKLVNIQDFLDHAPSQLSGGQKQRVSMGGVLVDDVDLLIFDEPLANLDPKTGKQAIELIDDLSKKTGVGVIIVEHRLEDVLHRHVDRVVIMDKGRIVTDTTPDELVSSDILQDKGVREPLYIAAMKYAGIKVTPDLLPGSIDTVKIGDEESALLKKWYEHAPKETIENNSDYLLDIRNLSFSYDGKIKALDNISIKVKSGEMLAIVGTNGAGK